MNGVTLTPAIKDLITTDWSASFPNLGVYKPLWLLKRHGPLLVGILLDRTSSNEVYIPKFHVHNLLNPSRAVTLSLVYPLPHPRRPRLPREIKLSKHAEEFSDAARTMASIAPEITAIEISWPQLVDAHCRFIEGKRDYAAAKYCAGVFRDIAMLANWCGHVEYSTKCVEDSLRIMRAWTPPIDIDKWVECVGLSSSKQMMESTLSQEISRHKLERVPVFELNPNVPNARSITKCYEEIVW